MAAYVEAASKKSDFERTELSSKHKSGVFTGGLMAGAAVVCKERADGQRCAPGGEDGQGISSSS